jgi:hypothetical protein
MFRFDEFFCLACGETMARPLQRTASLRCHDCREAGEPISFELALRARAMTLRPRVAGIRDVEPPVGRTAA